jgi:hypothetical protein
MNIATNKPLDLALVFRATLNTYLSCVADGGRIRNSRNGSWSNPRIEFAADFLACVKRTLSPAEFATFAARYLQGPAASDRRVDGQLAEIERRLAVAFLAMQPHALYPAAGYFGSADPKVVESCRALAAFMAPAPAPRVVRQRAASFYIPSCSSGNRSTERACRHNTYR